MNRLIKWGIFYPKWISTMYILRTPPKWKRFLGLFSYFSRTLSYLCRLSASYGGAFLNHAAKIIIKPTFCWSIIINNSFCKVEVAKWDKTHLRVIGTRRWVFEVDRLLAMDYFSNLRERKNNPNTILQSDTSHACLPLFRTGCLAEHGRAGSI